MTMQVERAHGLEALGIVRSGRVHWNLSPAALYEEALRRDEGLLAETARWCARRDTTPGVRRTTSSSCASRPSEQHVHWGAVNRPIDDPAQFDALHRDMMAYLRDKELFVLDAWAGAAPDYRLPIRIVTEFAWHNLFARNMFLPENDPGPAPEHRPEFTVVDIRTSGRSGRHGTRSDVFILVHFGRSGWCSSAAPLRGRDQEVDLHGPQLPAAAAGCALDALLGQHRPEGDTALFFGLSGTGKTTLSSDPDRRLIGDDEHGWSDTGVFNFEGGCYAKVIKLSAEAEPQIYATTRRFGTILENVVTIPTRAPSISTTRRAPRTRAGRIRSVHRQRRAVGPGRASPERHHADGRRLRRAAADRAADARRAMYHFLSGYTARVAGTEKGSPSRRRRSAPASARRSCRSIPTSTPRCSVSGSPGTEREVWLVNTGWTGGPYGVGSRMKIAHTRAMITAALTGQLDARPVPAASDLQRGRAGHLSRRARQRARPRGTWPEPRATTRPRGRLAQNVHRELQGLRQDVPAAVHAGRPRRWVAEGLHVPPDSITAAGSADPQGRPLAGDRET
jgi:phosphoenolpyruvate carboxykinase (ATP)